MVEHSERPKELCLQLAISLGLEELAIQPNFIAEGVALRLDSLIVGSFLELLDMVEIFATYNHQFSEFL